MDLTEKGKYFLKLSDDTAIFPPNLNFEQGLGGGGCVMFKWQLVTQRSTVRILPILESMFFSHGEKNRTFLYNQIENINNIVKICGIFWWLG